MLTGFNSSSFWTEYLKTQRSKLPELPDVDDSISDRVVRFLGGNPGDMELQGTNTYLIGTGNNRILIDTGEGFSQWAMNITRHLEDHDISISHVLLTHWHGDHTGGVPDLVAHDFRTRVHKYKPDQGQETIKDGQTFRTQGATLRAVLTPGHTADHTCFVLEEENALFTGDTVLGYGYSVAQDLGAYTASLRLISSLGCTIGYPGHGAVIRDLPRKIAMYITQRDSREQLVYQALVQQASSGSLRYGINASVSNNKRNTSSGRGGDSGGSGLDNDGNEIGAAQGLSTTEISFLLYGDPSMDKVTFESALKPLLDQVLFMLEEHGKVSSKLVGRDKTRYWFARVQPTMNIIPY
ncbi:Metallo-hydrolase/oxidoreductase [Xylariaceae sp. AK1471]|nr:Metallo-hydrolase/oxidoreductase [Xylariaceae sp. AK1471]